MFVKKTDLEIFQFHILILLCMYVRVKFYFSRITALYFYQTRFDLMKNVMLFDIKLYEIMFDSNKFKLKRNTLDPKKPFSVYT